MAVRRVSSIASIESLNWSTSVNASMLYAAKWFLEPLWGDSIVGMAPASMVARTSAMRAKP